MNGYPRTIDQFGLLENPPYTNVCRQARGIHHPMNVPVFDIYDFPRYLFGILRDRFADSLRAWEANGELEDWLSEAIVVGYEMRREWDPARCRSFKDFVSTYFPLRMIDRMRKEPPCEFEGELRDVESFEWFMDAYYEVDAMRFVRLVSADWDALGA